MEKLLLSFKEIVQLKIGPKFVNKKIISLFELTPRLNSDNNAKNYSQPLIIDIIQVALIC
jgi:hypothetical protein